LACAGAGAKSAGGGRGHVVVVDRTIAVVINPITKILGPREDVTIAVVAVALANAYSVSIHVQLIGRYQTVAVVILPVAKLGGARVDGVVQIVTVHGVDESISVGIRIARVAKTVRIGVRLIEV
jgi:hypothetical protein